MIFDQYTTTPIKAYLNIFFMLYSVHDKYLKAGVFVSSMVSIVGL